MNQLLVYFGTITLVADAHSYFPRLIGYSMLLPRLLVPQVPSVKIIYSKSAIGTRLMLPVCNRLGRYLLSRRVDYIGDSS
jgi:hypothetical protein